MARKPRKPLTPIRDLTPRQQTERRTARAAGFRDEFSYRRWVRAHQNMPQQHFLHLRKGLSKQARIAEIKRIRGIERRLRSPADEILRKYKALVVDDGWTNLNFWLRYRADINDIIAHAKTRNTADSRKMRRLRKELTTDLISEGEFDDIT